jgi:hypothetical protein
VIAHLTVGGEARFPRALGDGRIEGWPVFDVAGHDPGHLEGAMVRLRRQGHDHVEGGVSQRVEGLLLVPADLDADLAHDLDGEGIDIETAHADGVDIDPAAMQVLEISLRHGRAHRVLGAGEKDR